VAEAAEERGLAVAILIDEIQYFSSTELSALIMAMHRMQQRQLPLISSITSSSAPNDRASEKILRIAS